MPDTALTNRNGLVTLVAIAAIAVAVITGVVTAASPGHSNAAAVLGMLGSATLAISGVGLSARREWARQSASIALGYWIVVLLVAAFRIQGPERPSFIGSAVAAAAFMASLIGTLWAPRTRAEFDRDHALASTTLTR